MNYNDMRKPLVQSALVLLAVLIIIGFVAGSGAEGFFGGIASIIKGILYSVLFGVALGLSLVISLALLIAVYIGAIAIYSPEKAKETFSGLQQKIITLTASWTSGRSNPATPHAAAAPAENGPGHYPQQTPATSQAPQNVPTALTAELATIKKSIDSLTQKNAAIDQALADMNTTVTTFSAETISERIDQLESRQEEVYAKLDECLQNFEKLSSITTAGAEKAEKQEQELTAVQKEMQALASGLKELRDDMATLQKSSASERGAASAKEEEKREEEYRIFSYLEKGKDKEQFAKLVAEAVQQGMTYAEIDAFLSKSLPKKTDEIIKDHPSLTKDYIRACKNK